MAASSGLAMAADMPGEGKEVRLARPTWDTGWFNAAVYQRLLEGLGYEVSGPVTLDNAPFYQSVGQGDVDLWANGWFPQHTSYESEYEPGAQLLGYVAKGGALQGYMVDKKTADAHGITGMADFRKPEIAALFDTNGDGKAEMVSCPPGWLCERIIAHQLEAYGLEDTVEPVKASYAASMADALGRYRAGEPVFFYSWTPSWMIGLLKPGEDAVWLEVPEPALPDDQKEYLDAVSIPGVKGCASDPCMMGFPGNDIRPVVNKRFMEENPAAARLIELAEIPLDDIAAQNARMFDGEDSEKDILRHAEEWIEKNRAKVEGWYEEARKAAGS
ncbi:glycine betaine/L-proline ABC transporter substrate-binding protein ProX [Geminicoccaceae bacterium 1502E]|nr:glycine betaine/L-proline ABC transporter substrate-binding protein ProX [Geminicoccaceae bacterium 1502E]